MKTKDIKNNFLTNLRIAFTLALIACACVFICSAHTSYHATNFASNFGYNMGVAQAVLNGAVPYKDVFTQLGPLALLLYMLFSVVTNVNMVLLLQVICGVVFAGLTFRIAKKFLNDITSLLATAVVLVLVYTSSAYVTGGVIEEFLLPLFAYLILCLVEYSIDKKFSAMRIVLISISLSLIVWTKIDLIVFPILFLVSYIVLSIKNKQIKAMLLNLLVFVFVAAIVTMLMIWYLYINKCLTDFVSCYFVFGLNLQSSLINLANSFGLVLLAIVGIVFAIVIHKENLLTPAIVACVYLLSLLFTATENVNVLPLGVFAVLGVALMFEMFEKSNVLTRTKNVTKMVVSILLVMYCVLFSSAIWHLNSEKVSSGQTEIVSDIANYDIENPTLLCYKTDNFGLFNNTGINIGTKIFAENNILENDQELRLEFDMAMLEQKTDFILMEKETYETNKKSISEYYKLVDNYTITNIDNFITTETQVVLLTIK